MTDKETLRLNLLKKFETIASRDYKEIALHLPKDCIPIGFFCPYVPEELLHASGAFPIRLMGISTILSHAHAHLPPNCCYLTKSSLESLLKDELNFLKGIVFSHTCDSMQGLSDIWAHQGRLSFHFDLMVPSHLDSELAQAFFKKEIERFREFLNTHIGKITPQKLKASIDLFNQIREKLGEIYVRRQKNPTLISNRHFAQLIRAGYLIDGQQYLEGLIDLLNLFPEKKEGNGNSVPVYVAGNMTHSVSYFSLIEEAGAVVVGDDLCSGARFLRLRTPELPDPIEALTQRYFTSFLCPTKYRGPQAHQEMLLTEVQKSGAKGVIFLLYKYCENHYFDHPDLKSVLESQGIPTLLLEVDDPSYSLGQLKIRIQAFVEMLNPI